MSYCACVGKHDKNCPNAGKPDALPPLRPDKNDKKGGRK